MKIKLDVPYRSQHHNKIRNDCGAACVAMLVNKSVDEVLTAIDQPPHRPLSFAHLFAALRHYGVACEFVQPLMIPRIKGEITDGHPVILLANYTAVERPQSQFDGAHFFLGVGVTEGGVLVHDPNWQGDRIDRGYYLALPDERLEEAMRQPGWGNQPYQGIVINRVYPSRGGAPPPPPPVEDTLAAVTAELRIQLDLLDAIRVLVAELAALVGVEAESP